MNRHPSDMIGPDLLWLAAWALIVFIASFAGAYLGAH
jgi:hypothetical protein